MHTSAVPFDPLNGRTPFCLGKRRLAQGSVARLQPSLSTRIAVQCVPCTATLQRRGACQKGGYRGVPPQAACSSPGQAIG